MPSTVALIIALPCFLAVTQPFSSTQATLCLFDFQVGVIPDETELFSVKDCPLKRVSVSGSSLITGVLTLTLHCAVEVSAFTVIIASPGLQPVTTPLSSITATLDLLLLKVIWDFVDVVTFNLKLSPCSMEIDFFDKTILVLLTVILQLISVFWSFTFILHVPGALAVISPREVTEAILLFVLL